MIHRFANVEVDIDLTEVRVDGVSRTVEPQVFRVLVHLLEQGHRVVPKEELLDEVWGTRFVSDAAITSRIKSARQAIGDNGRDQRFIRTVHGRGYRFVAPLVASTVQRAGRSAVGRSRATATRPVGEGRVADRPPDQGWPLVGRDREVEELVALVSVGGCALLTGPAGIGKTHLARAVAERCEAAGLPTARINGHSEATGIPLAALAHLLPGDIADAIEFKGELARTVVLERARRAIADLAGTDKLVLMVDDVDRVDSLSLALLASLRSVGAVAAVMTQRDAGEAPMFEQLISSGEIRRVDLGPVAPEHLAGLVNRVLDGPVRTETVETLITAADGNPGLLRQLVESSRTAGTLVPHGAIWHLTGPIATSPDLRALIGRRIDDLSPDERDAAELLALAGGLPLELAFELIADEALDSLELAGLISVRDVVREPRVRLSHPLFGEVLRAEVTTLRRRSIRQRLGDGLASWIERGRSTHRSDRLQLVRLRLDGEGELDQEMAIESVQFALLEGDVALAEQILDRIHAADIRTEARVALLRAEGLFMNGRYIDAGEVLGAIEIDQLEPADAAYVIRRNATAIFYGHSRLRRATDFLAEHFGRFEPADRAQLESYWVMLAPVDGSQTGAALELGERLLVDATGFVRAEALTGMAMAHLVRGELTRALDCTDEFERVVSNLPASLTWAGPEYARFVEIAALTELGRTADAWRIVEREVPAGTLPSLGFVAIAVGRLAYRTGRHEQALAWLTPLIQLADATGLATYARPMQATTARAALALGDIERARQDAKVLDAVPTTGWSLAMFDIRESVLRIEASVGDRDRAVADLIDLAATARRVGNLRVEAWILEAVVEFGGAAHALARLEELAEGPNPGLVELKVRHARAALADGPDRETELDEVAREYERIGLHTTAAAVRATPR